MISHDEFLTLVNSIAERCSLMSDDISENIISLRTSGGLIEVARVIYMGTEKGIGVSFEINTVSSDAIQVFGICQQFNPEIKLLECFYIDDKGGQFIGIDAQLAAEQDREDRVLKTIEDQQTLTQEDPHQIEKIKRNGKITWH